jgi:hypothetical protein
MIEGHKAMGIVEFPRIAPAGTASGPWDAEELRQLIALFGAQRRRRVSSWDVGETERGEPQFYMLGPGPDYDCVMSVSRLARGYVLEDGTGRIMGEAPALHHFAEQTARSVARRGRSLVARATLLICAIRLTIEEKIEPIFEESQELLVRFAPQIAAFV